MFENDAAAFEGDLTVAATAGILRGAPDAMANFHADRCEDCGEYGCNGADDWCNDAIVRGTE